MSSRAGTTTPERRRSGLVLAAAVLAISLATAVPAQAQQFLFSSNSGELNGKESITPFTVEPDGSLDPHPTIHVEGPEGVAVTPDARFLYVATNEGKKGELSGFAIGAEGSLAPVPGSPFATNGQGASGVAITPAGDRVVVTNRGEGGNNKPDPGSIAVFDIDPANGALAAVKGSPFPPAGIEDPSRVAITPDGRRVLTPGDVAGAAFEPRVAVFDLDQVSGALAPVTGSPFASGGKQPVPIVISPDGSRVFVGNVNLSAGAETISVLDLNQESGALSPVTGSPFTTAGPAPIALALSPDGARLFSGERGPPAGERGVSVYDIGADGALSTLIGSPFTSGNREVRGTVVSPDGRNVYAITSAEPGAVVGYAIAGTGALSPLPESPYPTGDQFSGAQPIAMTPVQSPQPAFSAAPLTPGSATAFDASATTVRGGRATRYDWDFGDGTKLLDAGPAPSHAFAKPGKYAVTLSVTNDCAPNAVFAGATVFTGQTAHCNGMRTASLTKDLTISAADGTAPVISKLRIGKRFSAGTKPTAKASRSKIGTKITFTLSENASTRIAFQRRTGTGKRARFKGSGFLTRKGKKGKNSVRFSGRVGRSAPLKPGRYRVVVSATDAAGNTSAKRRRSFRILAPAPR